MPKKIDLIGQRFGRWTVIEEAEKNNRGRILWKCRCDCGIERKIELGNLRSGNSKSCGCLKKENVSLQFTKHGGSRKERKERLYGIWLGMRKRCSKTYSNRYARYGGRGIRVCDEWQNDYAAFRKWALSNGYADDLQIDRIDNDGDYEPDNCKWVTEKENNRKTCRTHWVEINGERKTMSDWATKAGIDQTLATYHLKQGEPHFIAYIQQKLAEKENII